MSCCGDDNHKVLKGSNKKSERKVVLALSHHQRGMRGIRGLLPRHSMIVVVMTMIEEYSSSSKGKQMREGKHQTGISTSSLISRDSREQTQVLYKE